MCKCMRKYHDTSLPSWHDMLLDHFWSGRTTSSYQNQFSQTNLVGNIVSAGPLCHQNQFSQTVFIQIIFVKYSYKAKKNGHNIHTENNSSPPLFTILSHTIIQSYRLIMLHVTEEPGMELSANELQIQHH